MADKMAGKAPTRPVVMFWGGHKYVAMDRALESLLGNYQRLREAVEILQNPFTRKDERDMAQMVIDGHLATPADMVIKAETFHLCPPAGTLPMEPFPGQEPGGTIIWFDGRVWWGSDLDQLIGQMKAEFAEMEDHAERVNKDLEAADFFRERISTLEMLEERLAAMG